MCELIIRLGDFFMSSCRVLFPFANIRYSSAKIIGSYWMLLYSTFNIILILISPIKNSFNTDRLETSQWLTPYLTVSGTNLELQFQDENVN